MYKCFESSGYMCYEIIDNKLVYHNNILKEDDKYPFDKYIICEKIGSGKNGDIFLLEHKFLKVKHVLKIYKDDVINEKALAEVRKTIPMSLPIRTPIYFAAGKLDKPLNNIYVIMTFVKDSITLEMWIKKRNKFKALLKNNHNDARYNFSLLQNTLNLSFRIILDYTYINKNNITHGDMHSKNLLVCDSLSKSVYKFNIGSNKWYRKNFPPVRAIGSLNVNDIIFTLIDFGSSQVHNTTKNYGVQKDMYNLQNIINKLLRPYIGKISNYIEFDYNIPLELGCDLLRITLFINLIIGYIYSRTTIKNVSDESFIDISKLISDALPYRNYDSSIYDYHYIECLDLYVGEYYKSHINWELLWKYLKSNYKSALLFKTWCIFYEDQKYFFRKIEI